MNHISTSFVLLFVFVVAVSEVLRFFQKFRLDQLEAILVLCARIITIMYVVSVFLFSIVAFVQLLQVSVTTNTKKNSRQELENSECIESTLLGNLELYLLE